MRRNSHPPRKSTRQHPAGWQQQPQRHNYRATAICGSLSLLTGAAVGAAVMYALDPESGRQRRQAAYDLAHSAYGTAHHAVENVVGSARHAVGNAYDAVTSAKLPSTQQAMDAGQQVIDAGKHFFTRGLDSASDLIPQRRRPTDVSATTAASLMVGALAGGLAAMWLFDPDRGRGRRAWIGQKTTRLVNETGSLMRSTGRHLRNRVKGYAHDAQGYASDVMDSARDSQLAQRVRESIAQLGIAASSIRIAAMEGRVHLSGQMIRDQIERVVEMVRNMPGVRGIVNELQTESSETNQPSSSA